jgi:hypothetical protein
MIGTLAWRKVSKGHKDQNQLAIPTLALSRSGIRVSILWDTISAGQFQHPWFYEVNGYFHVHTLYYRRLFSECLVVGS